MILLLFLFSCSTLYEANFRFHDLGRILYTLLINNLMITATDTYRYLLNASVIVIIIKDQYGCVSVCE